MLFFINICLYGQLAVVSDKDGFVNVRSDAKINSNIIDTLHNESIIFIVEQAGNWANIDYDTRNTKEKTGFIYKDRYRFINSYPAVGAKKQTDSTITFTGDSVAVTISIKKFEKEYHPLQYTAENNEQLQLIDDKIYFVRDGDVPTMEYSSITLVMGNAAIQLPKEAFITFMSPTLLLPM